MFEPEVPFSNDNQLSINCKECSEDRLLEKMLLDLALKDGNIVMNFIFIILLNNF